MAGLTKGLVSNPLQTFLKKQNAKVQEDPDKAMKEFADQLEELIFKAIESATLVLPTGAIQVQGTQVSQQNIVTLQIPNALQ